MVRPPTYSNALPTMYLLDNFKLRKTSLKWLTVMMLLLETSERLEEDKIEMKLWLMA